MNTGVSTFTAAAAAFRSVTRNIPEDSWSKPGLGHWDIRTLVGHTAMAVRGISECLTVAAQREDLTSPASYYVAIRQFAQTAGANELNTKLSRRAAEALGADPVAEVDRILDKALLDLQTSDDRLIGVLGGVVGIRLSSFIPTRTFELAVHTLDLARALDLPHCLPDVVIADAVVLAAQIAVQTGQGSEVLLSLTGRTDLPSGFSAL